MKPPITFAAAFATAVSTWETWAISHNLHVVAVTSLVAAIFGFLGAKVSAAAWAVMTGRTFSLRVQNVWKHIHSTVLGLFGLLLFYVLHKTTDVDTIVLAPLLLAPSIYLILYGRPTPPTPPDAPLPSGGGVAGTY